MADQGLVRETACAIVGKLKSGEVTPLDLLDVLEKRIADSIAATASVIVGAWEAAGKPALKTDMPRTVQKIKK